MEAGQSGIGRILMAVAPERNVRDGGRHAIGAPAGIPLVVAAHVVDWYQQGHIATAPMGC